MRNQLILATNHSLAFVLQNGDNAEEIRRALSAHYATSVTARNGVILAGTQEGLFRSTDGGSTWDESADGLSINHIRWLSFHPEQDALVFAGTEPAGIFVSQDEGKTWQSRPEVARLRDRFGWWLPYSPESGCVRGFAFHGSRGYAAVEVGGLLRSDNSGATWSLAPGSDGKAVFRQPPPGYIHADVHSVAVHPSSPDLVFAPTNAGLYRSSNGGKTFERINDFGYTRAVWANPDDPDHLILGPARGVGREGTVQETRDGGETWRERTDGLTTPWPRAMVDRFTQIGDELFMVVSNGDVYRASLHDLRWRPFAPEIEGVNAIA